ncbi:MAG TPA: DUF4328 domain-containing protein [Actinomycetota bacterium]|nr:DUF4328 domain-containing protein [Actinomycetota bacterium]
MLTGLLIAGIATDTLNIALTAVEHATLQRYLDGEATAGEANRAIERSGLVGIVILVVFVATAIAWLVWQHRSQANLRAAGVSRLAFTPGWAVGWWFVPVASLWKPFQAVRELHEASTGDLDWSPSRAPALLGWWWAGWLVLNVLDGIAGVLFADESGSVEPLLIGDRFSIAGDLVSIATAVLAIRVVGAIVERQRRLPAVVAARPPVPPRPDLRPLPWGALP